MWFYYSTNFAARAVPKKSANDPTGGLSRETVLYKIKLPPHQEGLTLDHLTALYPLPIEATDAPAE